MQDSAIPAKFPIPFANNAGGSYIRTIPQASQVGVQNGAASLYDGFPPNCFTPVAGGGSPPFGKDFNGLLKQVTAWQQWEQAGGPISYDAAFSSAIGGYPNGALLNSTPAGFFWQSLVDNNTSDPDTGGANWRAIYPNFSNRISFAASTTWTAPAWCNMIFADGVWGAGGGGGAGVSGNDAAGGGGSGGFARGFAAVVPGRVYNLGAGTAGAGALGNTSNAGTAGGSSYIQDSVTSTYLAIGFGGAPGAGSSAGNVGAGGAGGSASGTGMEFAGGNSGGGGSTNTFGSTAIFIGGSGACSPFGSGTVPGTFGQGSNGTGPGGGGGGGANGGGGGNGGGGFGRFFY